MNQAHPQSLARILASPWHQRRNAGGLWGLALVVALCFAAPVVLFGWSLFSASTHSGEALRTSARASAWVGVAALLVAGWAMLVGNVLQQNHPTLARLVPHHVAQLRLALLVAWALASLAAAGLPGFAFGAPLAWACGVAALLALLAAALRWPPLWLGGIAAPFLFGWLTRHFDAGQVVDALAGQWRGREVLVTCVVVTAGASVLVGMVRGGGNRHMAAYEARRRLNKALASPAALGGGGAPACSRYGWIAGLATNGRPYAWWMDRLLARPGSPLMARLLVGLGPATHWTTRLFQAFWFLAVSAAMCGLGSLLVSGDMFAYVLPWLGFSVLTGLSSPALQAVPQLQQTRREQALLVLLPGVPRGPRLNRWLAWQMSVSFVLASLLAFATAWALDGAAGMLRPGLSANATGGMTFGLAAALLPQVAWQWRRWARLPGASGGVAQIPTLAPVVLGLALVVLHAMAGVGYVDAGVALAAAALAWCAWRWWRMGAEPTAFPVGRLR